MDLAKRSRCGARKLAEEPGEVTLVIKAEVERDGAQGQRRVSQALSRSANTNAIQVFPQRLPELLAKDVAQIDRMDLCGMGHLGQSQVLVEMSMHVLAGAPERRQGARYPG